MTAARAQAAAGQSNRLKTLQIARREMRMDDEVYRDVLQLVVGQRSAAGLDDRQLGKVLDHFKAHLGWKPSRPASRGGRQPAGPRRADHPTARKARALWLSLHQLGVVDNPSEQALEAFAKRQLGVDRLQWANQREGFRLIEALKAIAERAGWSQEGSLTEILARLEILVEARRHG